MNAVDDACDGVRQERDLYAKLLQLNSIDGVEGVLDDALGCAVRAVGAERGYLAIYGADHEAGDAPRWGRAMGCSKADLAEIEQELSTTIIDHTLRTRQVKVIPSAQGDPQFALAESVRINRITSVVCAPVGSDGRGILYLQGRIEGGIFGRKEESYVVRLGQLIGPSIDRVVRGADALDPSDPTTPWRRGNRFGRVVGRSESLAVVLRQLHGLMGRATPVLLNGPSGAGKALLAREMTEARLGLFVHVRCESLAVSGRARELLLGVEGAAAPGHIERADGGTLFLADLDRLPLDAQQELVELIDTGRVCRVGGSVACDVNTRIITTTTSDPEELVRAGTLRDDLYQRLLPQRVDVPGLEARSQDVALLLEHFAMEATAELHQTWHGASDDTLAAARAATWSHHVRELGGRVRKAVREVAGTRPLRPDDLFPAVEQPTDGLFDGWMRGPMLPLKEAQIAFRTAYIQRALVAHERNITAAARSLGVSRSRMFALINELGLRDHDEE